MEKRFLAVTKDSYGVVMTQVPCATVTSAKRVCTRNSVGATDRLEVWEICHDRVDQRLVSSRRLGFGLDWYDRDTPAPLPRIKFIDKSTDKTYRPTKATIEKIIGQGLGAGNALEDLIDMAVAHWYGKYCSLWRDRELYHAGIYGQVVEPCTKGGVTCRTPRIRIDMVVNDTCNVSTADELEEALPHIKFSKYDMRGDPC